MIHDGLWCAFECWHMGEAAEHIAAKCGVSRAEQDRFAAQSHRRAAAAWERGAFSAEIVPVTVGSGPKAKTRHARRRHSAGHHRRGAGQAETVLPGRRHGDGRQRLDAQRRRGRRRGWLGAGRRATRQRSPWPAIVAYATSGVAPKDIFIAPVYAVRQVLERAGLGLKDIDLFELNEAFAAQMLACGKELQAR